MDYLSLLLFILIFLQYFKSENEINVSTTQNLV